MFSEDVKKAKKDETIRREMQALRKRLNCGGTSNKIDDFDGNFKNRWKIRTFEKPLKAKIGLEKFMSNEFFERNFQDFLEKLVNSKCSNSNKERKLRKILNFRPFEVGQRLY